MGDSCLIMHKVYRNRKGRDVFHLALAFQIQEQRLTVMSNVPDFITNNLEILAFEENDLFPVVNEKKVKEISDYCAKQVFNNPLSKQYFYPDCYLDGDDVRQNIMLIQDREIKSFLKARYIYASTENKVLVCHYFFVIILNERNWGLPDVHSLRIKRKTFELQLNILDANGLNEYLDLFWRIKRFIEIRSTSYVPSFIGALNSKGEVLFVLIKHIPSTE